MEHPSTDFTGHLVLLMAPSGSGKKSVFDTILASQQDIYFAKTLTSRAMRNGAEENPLYSFITETDFTDMIKEQEFVEWANYSGNYYGTPKSEIVKPLQEGKLVFKEMELQGVLQMKKVVPAEHRTIVYIDGGDWSALEKRILARAEIDPQELTLRKTHYEEEQKSMPAADIIIKNHDGMLEQAQEQMQQVMQQIINKVQS